MSSLFFNSSDWLLETSLFFPVSGATTQILHKMVSSLLIDPCLIFLTTLYLLDLALATTVSTVHTQPAAELEEVRV